MMGNALAAASLSIDHIPLPTAAGSLEAYLQSAYSMPMLSEAQEVDLARRFRNQEDLGAART